MDRALNVLETLARSPDCSMAEIAERTGLPFSSTYRIVQSLINRGYVAALGRGHYAIGARALALSERSTLRHLFAAASRPILAKLARACRAPVHLGVFEGDMVTYLVKQQFGRRRLLSREGTQLEAYCTAIGKVLLAHLETDDRETYLSNGLLVPLTSSTIITASKLRRVLSEVRAQGWAAEFGETVPNLSCLAVPVQDHMDKNRAALSVSIYGEGVDRACLLGFLPELSAAALKIQRCVFGRFDPPARHTQKARAIKAVQTRS